MNELQRFLNLKDRDPSDHSGIRLARSRVKRRNAPDLIVTSTAGTTTFAFTRTKKYVSK